VIAEAPARTVVVGHVAGGLLEVGHEAAPLEDLGQDVRGLLTGEVHTAEPVLDYLQDLVNATRSGRWFLQGLSPRAAIALRRAAQARALIEAMKLFNPFAAMAMNPGAGTAPPKSNSGPAQAPSKEWRRRRRPTMPTPAPR